MTTYPANVQFTAAKAYVGGAIGAVVAGLSVVFTGLDDGIITQQEWVGAAIATLVAAGGVFGGVYATTNHIKSK